MFIVVNRNSDAKRYTTMIAVGTHELIHGNYGFGRLQYHIPFAHAFQCILDYEEFKRLDLLYNNSFKKGLNCAKRDRQEAIDKMKEIINKYKERQDDSEAGTYTDGSYFAGLVYGFNGSYIEESITFLMFICLSGDIHKAIVAVESKKFSFLFWYIYLLLMSDNWFCPAEDSLLINCPYTVIPGTQMIDIKIPKYQLSEKSCLLLKEYLQGDYDKLLNVKKRGPGRKASPAEYEKYLKRKRDEIKE